MFGGRGFFTGNWSGHENSGLGGRGLFAGNWSGHENSGLGGRGLFAGNWFGQEEYWLDDPEFSGGDLGCGPVDSSELNGALFNLVDVDLGLCSLVWSKSGDRRAVGALI